MEFWIELEQELIGELNRLSEREQDGGWKSFTSSNPTGISHHVSPHSELCREIELSSAPQLPNPWDNEIFVVANTDQDEDNEALLAEYEHIESFEQASIDDLVQRFTGLS